MQKLGPMIGSEVEVWGSREVGERGQKSQFIYCGWRTFTELPLQLECPLVNKLGLFAASATEAKKGEKMETRSAVCLVRID